MKNIVFVGTSQRAIKSFPDSARHEAGYQLMTVQLGEPPTDFKSMTSIGKGVKEIRIHSDGEFRVIYFAKFLEAVYVLHAFQKKSKKTPKKDIDLAKQRLLRTQRERKR